MHNFHPLTIFFLFQYKPSPFSCQLLIAIHNSIIHKSLIIYAFIAVNY